MGLLGIIHQDLGHILHDTISGFAVDVTIYDPQGNHYTLSGFTNDIATMIDPETGMAVSGRTASVVFLINKLQNIGLSSFPTGIMDTSLKPWTISFEDINLQLHKFKIIHSAPDHKIGMVTFTLEVYA